MDLKVNCKTKVSVLIPVYNGETYLSECLESVISQDFQDMEILVSNNCSTDRTVNIIKEFARRDSRIRWWTNPSNLGLVGNSNVCLRQARGELIKFLYHDDFLVSPQALRKMAGILQDNPSISLVASATQIIDEGSRFTGVYNPQRIMGLADGREVIIKSLEGKSDNNIGCPSVTMFRRQQAVRGFDRRLHYSMDIEMWFYLLEQGHLYWFAEPLATFRTHRSQESEKMRQPHFRNYDSLFLLKTMLQKDWLQKCATDRLYFSQIYYKRKFFGDAASDLILEMSLRLPLKRYFYQWLIHRLWRPIQKLAWHR